MKYLIWMPVAGLIPFVLGLNPVSNEKALAIWHTITLIALAMLI